ncbi:GntR family transcriptional regulator [Komagataeibacter xylinus]|uniref:GntR family transcriptional regulator n=1 Tax=Komagataeibacter xylinus TaxID=28448 RepID=UPI0010303888|nr:GntR family transcriptional regulator [Komagataeibacter xylinus]
MAGDSGSREGDRVYSMLRKRILAVDLEPGSVLDEARIVQDMGTSRTPVREAVIRLVSDGLLKRDGRQVIVPTFQVAQLRAFFETLLLYTRVTHRLAAERHSVKQLADIWNAVKAFEKEARNGIEFEMTDANHRFHRTIAAACDNIFFQEAYESILLQSLRLSRHCFVAGIKSEYKHREHLETIMAEHRAIAQAIEDGDADRTDVLATAHISLFRSWLSDQLLGPAELLNEMML